MSSINRGEKVRPTPPDSIGSRITWFTVAVAILVATWLVGLRLLPTIAVNVMAFGVKLPRGAQVVFTFGPAVLLSVGVVAAALLVMGEFKPALRGLRPPLIILVLFVTACSLATAFTLMMYPQSNCPSAPAFTSPAQPVSAP